MATSLPRNIMVRMAAAKNKAEAQLNAMDLEEVVIGHDLAYVVQTRMLGNGKLSFTAIV